MANNGSRLRSASTHLHARTFLPGLDPIGAGSAHRGRIDDRGAVAREPYSWNDCPRFWGWSRRLPFLFQACVTVS